MSRYLAAFYHLLISLVIFIFLAYLIIFEWYPDFFYTIDGGWEGMRIIVGVDLVLGPLLTLIVFKSGKPGLKFDLTSIALFQAACLTAGLYVLYIERPLFFVYYDEHFYTVNNGTFAGYGAPGADPADYSSSSPAYVIAELPDNAIEEAGLRRILYTDQIPLWVYSPTYTPLRDNMGAIMENGYNLAALKKRDEKDELTTWLARHPGTEDDYAFFPVHARHASPFIAIRRSDHEIVGILNVPGPVSGLSR